MPKLGVPTPPVPGPTFTTYWMFFNYAMLVKNAMPGDVRDPFGVYLEVRSGSVGANFGPKFPEAKVQNSKYVGSFLIAKRLFL